MPRTVDLSRGPALLSLSVGTASFAFATCIVRYCVRKRISNNVGIDDYAIGVATVSQVIKEAGAVELMCANRPEFLAHCLYWDYIQYHRGHGDELVCTGS